MNGTGSEVVIKTIAAAIDADGHQLLDKKVVFEISSTSWT
jgi:hypothetical protein